LKIPIIKDETKIEVKGDMFIVHKETSELVNAKQMLQIIEQITQQKVQADTITKQFEVFDEKKKLAQEVFMKQMETEKLKQIKARDKK